MRLTIEFPHTVLPQVGDDNFDIYSDVKPSSYHELLRCFVLGSQSFHYDLLPTHSHDTDIPFPISSLFVSSMA